MRFYVCLVHLTKVAAHIRIKLFKIRAWHGSEIPPPALVKILKLALQLKYPLEYPVLGDEYRVR